MKETFFFITNGIMQLLPTDFYLFPLVFLASGILIYVIRTIFKNLR